MQPSPHRSFPRRRFLHGTAATAAAIRCVLKDDREHLLCIGMRTPEEIDANLRVLHADPGLSAADREVLADYCAQACETEALKRLRFE